MTNDERFIARILFVNRVLKANNQAYQQLFWAVMIAKHRQAFVAVRPQGRLGDGGNDGFLPDQGHYFQIYGPVDPNDKITTAATKLASDFTKLKTTWDRFNEIRAYSFAYNDKYEATFQKIIQALLEIEGKNIGVVCRPFTAANLEDVFMGLSGDQMGSVLGDLLPDPSKIARLDYGVLKEVVDHILNTPARSTPTRFDELPELEKKIELNSLCGAWGALIRNGSRMAGHIDRYFEKNSQFAKQALRNHLVEIYQTARDEGRAVSTIPDGISREDLVFDNFRQLLLPQNATVATECAVEVLIAYYFEACDVFDPNAPKDNPSASP